MSNNTKAGFVNKVIRADIQKMSAYVVQDATGLTKLDAMENPYPWPGDLQGWPEVMSDVTVNRYPDPEAKPVVDAIRQVMAIAEQYDIVLGNGSDELIQLLIQSIAHDDALVLSPEPSFVMYKVLCDTNRVNYQGVPLSEDFQLDMSAMLETIKQHQPELIFLACPNNPTGVRYQESDIRLLIEASTGLVVIDEAYIAFSDDDALSLLDHYPNVVVMRTLSKMGLAGLRLGILIGSPEWISEVNKIRLPYNINTLTQTAAIFALQNYHSMLHQAEKLREQRQWLASALNKLPIAEQWASEANFILFKTQSGKARPIFESLKQQGVLIKCMDGSHPLVKDCLRVTVGTPEQNQLLVQCLTKAMEN